MSEPVEDVVAFVEGRLAPAAFEQRLYHDAALQQLLQAEQLRLDEADYTGDVYTYLIQQDFADPGDLLGMQDVLSNWLKGRGVASRPTEAYRERYELLTRA